MTLPLDAVGRYVADAWRADILPELQRFIALPALSPSFDADWEAHGHLASAAELVAEWCRRRPIAGLAVEVVRIAGRTPLLVAEIPAFGTAAPDDTVVLYGHYDKQPEMTGWRDGLGPWTPVVDGERLYGRGGADDGYSAFASLVAIEAVQASGGSHARCILLVEGSEESGSSDLSAYVDALAARIGQPRLIVCLDSGALDYERLWVTTSLRGLVGGTLTVEVLGEGVHSGTASGIVPDSFRIARTLLDRIEDATTGAVRLEACYVDIPEDRQDEAEAAADVLGRLPSAEFPFAPAAGPMTDDPVGQLLGRTWAPALTVTGADGLPPTTKAGNVLRPSTSLRLSMRLPPTCDADVALETIRSALLTDPPYGVSVSFDRIEAAGGWNAPAFAGWLRLALDHASAACFGAPAAAYGDGGSIPFMGMLGARYPDAQFVITGVLGPRSNAHGPNEFLDLPLGRAVTVTIASVLDAHTRRP
ncbi:MAG TPA: M20/M25/M40 family metallo-hydrolase [Acidimicrobiales bacterium]|nr:M20/M25/M40 family metallo-hydrolase [Acidimicrobiales bacterium]